MSSPQIASNLVPSSVSYGDVVYFVMPKINPYLVISGYNGSNSYLTIENTPILNAYSFVIQSTTGKTGSISNGDMVYILDAYTRSYYWYNENLHDYVEFVTGKAGESHAEWQIQLSNPAITTLAYGDNFFLVSQNGSQYPTNDNSGNLYINHSYPDTINSTFTLLYAPVVTTSYGKINVAELQCCTNNPIYSPYCGSFQGNKYTGSCDNILINYCNSVAMADPNCGCLLPSSYYTANANLGPPECIDSRCYGISNAYMTSSQNGVHCDITNCIVAQSDIHEENAHISKQAITQFCGNKSPASPNINNNNGDENFFKQNWLLITILIIVIIIIIILLIIFIVYISKKKSS